MNYWFAKGEVNVSSTRGPAGGFLVIYNDVAAYSIYDSVGHDDLLSNLAAQYRWEKSSVLNGGIRLFFSFRQEGIVISGVREVDNEEIEKDPAKYGKIIRKVLK